MAATSALLSGRRDVIVVSSVSCIYGMGNPAAFYENVVHLKVGQRLAVSVLLRQLVDSLYQRNDVAPRPGQFRVTGDTVDVYLAYSEDVVRIAFWGDEIDGIEEIDSLSGGRIATSKNIRFTPPTSSLRQKKPKKQPSGKYKTTSWHRLRFSTKWAKPLRPSGSPSA